MTSWIIIINYAIPVAGLMIVLFGMVMISTSSFTDKATRRFMMLFLADLALYLVSSLVSHIAGQDTNSPVFTQAAIFFESLFSSLLLPLLSRYMNKKMGENDRNVFMYAIDIIWIAYFALLGYAQMSNNIYYIAADNIYHRGPYYTALLIPPILIMIVMLIELIRRRSRLTQRQFYGFIAYIAIPVIGMLFQLINYGVRFVALSTVIASGIMMIIIMADQAEQAARQQRKVFDQEASLNVLKMRPHFIYNALMSIYYLCAENPSRAQEVILDFSTYLRKNFTSIAREEPIPFTEELDHARAYLAIEQVRFENDLFVEYDTPYTDFNVPPLTLQPLVENSVKHGVDPELDPLTIYISTKKTSTGYDVIVADTGPGFGSQQVRNTSGNRVALSNIRSRLEAAGGGLDISDREGGGSVVTLHICAR